jgi:hypothetical protein
MLMSALVCSLKQTSRLLQKPMLVGGGLLMRVARMVQRDGLLHPLCSHASVVERLDYTPRKSLSCKLKLREKLRE